jgi:phage gp29-like protein
MSERVLPMTKPVTVGPVLALARQSRFNPLRLLTPEWLGICLDQYDGGYFSQPGQLWEKMLQRDDTLASVWPKRRDEAAQRSWQIARLKGADDAEAAKHAAVLEFFYNHCSAVNSWSRSERGEFEKILAQMTHAVPYGFAAHHIVWRNCGTTQVEGTKTTVPAYTAEFEFVPLWFLENTTGTLRFDQTGFGAAGQEMSAKEWMITSGDGLMLSASIAFMFKRLSFDDWTIFNERYAQGKAIGRTSAGPDSPEGKAMTAMMESFNGDMTAVIHNDPNPGGECPITIMEPKGTASVDAFSKFIERQDRKLSALFRGADLSTMSAGQGEGTGASLQSDEGDVLARADASMIGGALRFHVDRVVLEAAFGEGTMPLAYILIDGEECDEAEDQQQLRENAGFLADRGVLIDAAEIADRMNIPIATTGGNVMVLGKAAAPVNPAFGPSGGDYAGRDRREPVNGTANSATDMVAILQDGLSQITGVVPEAFTPVGDILAEIIQAAKDGQLTLAEIADFAERAAERMPDLLTRELVEEVAKPLEGAEGAAVLVGARMALRRINQVENQA